MPTNEVKNQYQKQLRAERKEWGLCIQCGKKPPFEGRVRCEMCLRNNLQAHHKPSYRNAMRERQKKLRAERRAAGGCTDCGKPVYKEYTRCYEHYLRNQRAWEKNKEQYKINRLTKKEKTK